MAYSKILAGKIRKALAHLPEVEEKKMFGGLAFMVNGKMCLTASADQMMCRIDPEIHETAINRKGCQTVIMRGKEYTGWVYVNEQNLQTEDNFNYWVNLAIEFNNKLVT